MADPHHIETLDGFDRLTVSLYRLGLVVAALGLLSFAAWCGARGLDLWEEPLMPGPPPLPWALVWTGVALSVANMHLYARTIRWVIGAAAWTGAVLNVLALSASPAVAHWLAHAGLGFAFVALSAFALKEQFCFRIPGLRAVPLLLAGSLVPLVADVPLAAAALLAPAGLVLTALAVAKLRMPLHFDIGDKSKYQV